mgnify:CR=1 FL=1
MIRNSIYSLIKKRKSIRSFLDKPVERNKITKILDAGHWAPSGLNNQPWRFVVIKDKPIKDKISEFSKYSYIIKGADCLILVFLDKLNSYNLIKDAQAIGACIQNMLLFALELGVSSCWLGEIINKKDDINKFIKIDSRYDLMAAVAFGYSKPKTQSKRFPLDKLVLKEIL